MPNIEYDNPYVALSTCMAFNGEFSSTWMKVKL